MNPIKIVFKLKNTYSVNSILYLISRLPIIRNHVTDSIYQDDTFKVVGLFLEVVKRFFTIFLFKIFYVFFFIVFISLGYKSMTGAFITIFVMLTMAGTILNPFMLNPTKDKYYAIKLMRMDARTYALTDYFWRIIEQFIGMLFSLLVFGLAIKINILVVLLMPIFVSCLKFITNALRLKKYKNKSKLKNESDLKISDYIVLAILLGVGYVLPYFNIYISELIFLILAFISIVGAIPSLKYIIKYDNYNELYNKLVNSSVLSIGSITNSKIEYESAHQLIDDKTSITSKKTGYKFFNDLFFKRHHKVLISHARNVSILAGVCFSITIIIIYLFPEIKIKVNEFMNSSLSFFLFAMYFLNSGQRIANVLFFNCDIAMLTYNFYQEKKILLNIFKERLKRLVGINLLSSMTIAFSMVVIFCLTSSQINICNAILLFISINMMGFFFSIHNLVLYYLFQPFSKDAKQKSIPYSIIKGGTYCICLLLTNYSFNIRAFSLILIIFTIFYAIISLILVKVFAYRTFKIHK